MFFSIRFQDEMEQLKRSILFELYCLGKKHLKSVSNSAKTWIKVNIFLSMNNDMMTSTKFSWTGSAINHRQD